MDDQGTKIRELFDNVCVSSAVAFVYSSILYLIELFTMQAL